jgi:hypothetical protein
MFTLILINQGEKYIYYLYHDNGTTILIELAFQNTKEYPKITPVPSAFSKSDLAPKVSRQKSFKFPAKQLANFPSKVIKFSPKGS